MAITLSTRLVLIALIAIILTACGGGGGGAASPVATAAIPEPVAIAQPVTNTDPLDDELLALIAEHNLQGDAAFSRTLPNISEPLAQLGMKLFFSKSLGGDFDTACVTCHHPALGGADALSLPVGVGADDVNLLGPGRTHTDTGLPNVPRNSPTVFNSGLWDAGMFWDSRVESFGKELEANGTISSIRTPDVAFDQADPNAGPSIPAAQARFPVTSNEEMRGDTFEAGNSNDALRAHLAARIGGYGIGAGELPANTWLAEFQTAFGNGTVEELITFDNMMLAIAAYERSLVFTNNPFGEYIHGDLDTLTNAQKRGAILFYTSVDNDGAGCVNCHSGDAFTDGSHHTVAFPQFGHGKGDGTNDDFGRERESDLNEDRYRFRTPSLLNITTTAPYGHAGVYETLQQVLNHYNNPANEVDEFFDNGGACTLAQFEDLPNCAQLYPDSRSNSNAALQKLNNERNEPDALFPNLNLNNNERADIIAFLTALTDPCVTDRDCLAPWVPNTANAGPDEQQLNGRDANGNLL